jgi:hypothetical protein
LTDCRRCVECRGEEHHWLTSMPECPEEGEPYVPCKHCDARAPLCDQCMEAPVWPLTGDPTLCGDCRAGNAPPVLKLWNDHGTPLLAHVDCPVCGDASEVYSHFDMAGCYVCRWSGSLIRMHADAFVRKTLGPGDFGLTFSEGQLERLAAREEKVAGAFVPMSVGFVDQLPEGGWRHTSTPVADLTEAVGRARAETLLPRAPGVVTDRQVQVMDEWRARSADRSRSALSPIGDTIAVVGVTVLALLALAGIAISWLVTR